MSGDMRMRTVRGATRQNQRLPIARRMGWREQEQKKEIEMSDKDMVTVYERRDGSKPGLWSVYWYLGWDVFCSFSLAVGITSKNTMMVIVQAFCLLCFLGLTVWQLNHLTWSITDYRVRISSNLEKGAHVEQSDK